MAAGSTKIRSEVQPALAARPGRVDLAMKGEVKALIARAELAMRTDPDGACTYEELRRLAAVPNVVEARRHLEALEFLFEVEGRRLTSWPHD